MTTLQVQEKPGWNIVGHEHAIDILRRTLRSQQVRHAYLLAGPQHIGKGVLARRFAQTLLCTGGADPALIPTDPCNSCLSCRKVQHGNHPDLHIITRAPDKQFITIEQVRALQSDAARRTIEGRRNVFIIEDAQDMNMQAANCILKTLEEPELNVVLILTVPDAGLLLPTITSRVQTISLQLLTAHQIFTALVQHWHCESSQAELVSALAAGRLGWAVEAVEDDDLLVERKTILDLLATVPTLSTVQRFDCVQRLGIDGEHVRTILELWLLWWRDMVLTANNCLDLTVNADMRDLLKTQSVKIGSERAQQMVQSILQTQTAVEQNVNPRTAFEVLMLDVPHFR